MRLHFLGAAGEVTGSATLVETDEALVLVDFGMHQGGSVAKLRNRAAEVRTLLTSRAPDAIVLTHAHLDHCGRLPLLERYGIGRTIHCSPATIDLAPLVMRDSAGLQEADAAREHRRLASQGRDLPPEEEPLYSVEEAERSVGRLQAVEFGETKRIAKGISIRLLRNAHILGSASIEMTVDEPNGRRTLLFSGDVGKPDEPVARDHDPPSSADIVILESTYGDRDHRSSAETFKEFADVLEAAVRDRSKIFVPAFAVGRAQTLLYLVSEAASQRGLPSFPVVLDSPMALKATEIHRRWLSELVEPHVQARLDAGEKLLRLPDLRAARTTEESIALNSLPGPALIIATSGMCTGGRILHHLRHNLGDPRAHVLFVGFQAHGTLGRRLVEGEKRVHLFGEPIEVRASIHTLNGLSAHAGQSGLLWWLDLLHDSRPKVFLNHGEDRPRAALKAAIEKRFGWDVELPEYLSTFEVA